MPSKLWKRYDLDLNFTIPSHLYYIWSALSELIVSRLSPFLFLLTFGFLTRDT